SRTKPDSDNVFHSQIQVYACRRSPNLLADLKCLHRDRQNTSPPNIYLRYAMSAQFM
ncbi:hypothetical protein J6590_078484, partial [Homalodisca vitripennis]